MRTVLAIGGPRSGERFTVPPGLGSGGTITLPSEPEPSAGAGFELNAPADASAREVAPVKGEIYRLDVFRLRDADFFALVHDDIGEGLSRILLELTYRLECWREVKTKLAGTEARLATETATALDLRTRLDDEQRVVEIANRQHHELTQRVKDAEEAITEARGALSNKRRKGERRSAEALARLDGYRRRYA